MIIGVFGEVCSGKSTFASILESKHGFKIISIENIIKELQINEDELDSLNLKMDQIKFESYFDEYTLKPKISNRLLKLIETVKEVLNKNSDKKIILYPINSEIYDLIEKRTFSKFVSIKRDFQPRYLSYCQKYSDSDIQKFIEADQITNKKNRYIESKKSYTLYNDGDLVEFETKISNLLSSGAITKRISWERYFMDVAFEISQRSNCIKHRVGCIIVKNNRIQACGFNGTPSKLKNCYEGGCERCMSFVPQGINLEACVCIHAEENAILEIGRKGAEGCDLYCTTYPCAMCAKIIISSGIKRVFFTRLYHSLVSEKILKDAQIEIIFFEPKINFI